MLTFSPPVDSNQRPLMIDYSDRISEKIEFLKKSDNPDQSKIDIYEYQLEINRHNSKKVPDGDVKRRYIVSCKDKECFEKIHSLLTEHSDEENIPCECITCCDSTDHSEKSATYLLTISEVEKINLRDEVQTVSIDSGYYRDSFRVFGEDIFTSQEPFSKFSRYEYGGEEISNKNYRNFSGSDIGTQITPSSPNSDDRHRTGYQLLRLKENNDPWINNSQTVIETELEQYGDGSGVDIIVNDDGCWIGHIEFANNITSQNNPQNYVGGNVLPGNGTCDVLDLVLDSPYYIDPDWFNADPDQRLMTRWDGTTVPREAAAKTWWRNASERSSNFSGIGTVDVNPYYTREQATGSIAKTPGFTYAGSLSGYYGGCYHGTSVASQAFGRTHGWAYNANKWTLQKLTTTLGAEYGIISETNHWDIIKIFHKNKPINASEGNRNPTIVNNSWRGGVSVAGFSGKYYWFRPSSNTGSSPNSGQMTNLVSSHPAYLKSLYGTYYEVEPSFTYNASLLRANEAIDSGVIICCSSANNNQNIASYDSENGYNQDFLNYLSSSSSGGMYDDLYSSDLFGNYFYLTTNRRGYPQCAGRTIDYDSDGAVNIRYPVISVGGLDDNYDITGIGYSATDGKEHRSWYSAYGSGVDIFAPADGTMAAFQSGGNADQGSVRPSTGLSNRFDNTYNSYTSSQPFFDAGTTVLTNGLNMVQGTHNFSAAENTAWRINTSSANNGTVSSISLASIGPNVGIASTVPDQKDGLSHIFFKGQYYNGYWRVDIPWNISYCGVSTSRVYVSSSSGVFIRPTGGISPLDGVNLDASTSAYPDEGLLGAYISPSFSAINPSEEYNIPCILISNSENSCQRIIEYETGTTPNRKFYIRYEGNNDPHNGVLGSPTIIWEMIFYENIPAQIDVHIGPNSRYTQSRLVSYDWAFAGTSASCPIATGLLATKLQYNRTWNWRNLKQWINNQIAPVSSSNFYVGSDGVTANDDNWNDDHTLLGQSPKVLYDAKTNVYSPQFNYGNNTPVENKLKMTKLQFKNK